MGRLILLLVTVCALTTFGQEIENVEIDDSVLESTTDSPAAANETFYEDWLLELLNSSDACAADRCANGGTCQNVSDGGFTCHCPEPFTGRFCHEVKNYCKTVTCGHGSCNFIRSSPFYECKCRHPYRPPHCTTGVICDPNPCQNGGTCVNGSDPMRSTFQCFCPSGYSGKFCDVGPNDCFEENGESYRGNVSVTEEGDECLDWNSFLVLDIIGDPFTVNASFDGIGPHNFCRNPDSDSKPWCFYKQNHSVEWKYCNVKQCSTGPETHPTTLPTTPPDPVSFSECGKPQLGAGRRIVFGNKAVPAVHPWQASIQAREINSNRPFRHFCGGTLLSSCWVLTAAHCLQEMEDTEMLVALGGVDIEKLEVYDQFIPVEKFIVHEDYRQTLDALYNDIALLKLKVTEKPLCAKETRFVKTACLPDKRSKNGTECVVSGWGKTDNKRSSRQSRYLRQAEVFQISQEKCRASEVYGDVVDDSMFCAGHMEGGMDACEGDSGGPLVCEHEDTHYVEGVVSFGLLNSCGKKFKPGIYANVPKFLSWIRKHMNS